jgi:hypothetical protein
MDKYTQMFINEVATKKKELDRKCWIGFAIGVVVIVGFFAILTAIFGLPQNA